jgi:hypothetical protein
MSFESDNEGYYTLLGNGASIFGETDSSGSEEDHSRPDSESDNEIPFDDNIPNYLLRLPNDLTTYPNVPYGNNPAHKLFPIHNRAVKAFDTLLTRVRRATELSRCTVEGCIKDMKMLDIDKFPEYCAVREKLTTMMRDAMLQAQTRSTFFEEISNFLESEIKVIVRENFPQNVEDFVSTQLCRITSKPPMWFPMNAMTCQLCIDRTADCRLMPGRENYCKCKDMGVCVQCMLRHYWVNSDRNRKSFATCPQCRGEFTLSDLLYVSYEEIYDPLLDSDSQRLKPIKTIEKKQKRSKRCSTAPNPGRTWSENPY